MEDELELQELNSSHSSKTFMKRDNKVRSPPHAPKVTGRGDGNNDITNLFLIKNYSGTKPLQTPILEALSRKIDKNYSQISDTLSETQEMSQISDEVFQDERKASIDSPSRTDSRSYRDRVKNRFLMIKENAGKSAHKASFKDTTKKLIMERIRQENDSIEFEIEQKRKTFGRTNIDNKKMYDFFVGENGPPEVEKWPEAEGVHEIINKSTEQLIGECSDDETLVEMKYPENLRFQQKAAEVECLFRPSGKTIELSKKLTNEEPRYLEDEGFFVPPRPNISRISCNILEERLLSIGDKWFNCQGELAILESPLTGTSIRPQEHQNLDEKLTIFAKPTLHDTECQEIVVIKENILQVIIKNLKFYHHPLFSLEHVLERQLRKTANKYEIFLSNHTLKKMYNRLEATRHILLNAEKTSGDDKREKISKYKKDIKELRDALLIQGKEERQLLKYTLTLWKNIKKLRARNGYTVTPVKLIIHRESQNIEADKKLYEENLQKAYQEILREYRDEFKNKMRDYKKTLQEIQDSPRSETEAIAGDSPKKPTYNVDEDAVFNQLKTKFGESFRNPGEPTIRFRLSDEVAVTEEVDNRQEKARRNSVASTKIFLKIICNKLTVCKTKPIPLDDRFEVNVNEKMSILLTNTPKFIKVVVMEQSNKNSAIDVNLPVPFQTVSRSKMKNAREEFEKIGSATYKHEGVGSGIELRKLLESNDLDYPSNLEDSKLNTAGSVHYQSFWRNSGNEENGDNVVVDEVLEAVVDKNGTIQIDKLAEWIGQTNPDPQNPRNSVLYEYIQEFSENLTALNKNNYFRLNPYQKSLEFCDISEIDDNIRMKILQLRNQNEPEFDGMVVPNRIKEIPRNILKDYKRRIANEREGLFMEESKEEGYDSRRKNGMRIMKQIHTKVFQKCKNSTNNLEIDDILDEKYLVYFENLIKTLTTNFFNWFRWKPQMSHPLPELKKSNVEKVQTSNQELSSLVKITVKVLNAVNIPDRDVSVQKSQHLLTDQVEANSTVKSYVEVRFNDIFDRTTAVEGTQPVWNEDLTLILSPCHFDYLNPNSLSGSIMLNVFDEVNQNIQNKEVKTGNWLGSIEAPLSAICSNNGMAGHFKLNIPNVLFGYVREDMSSSSNQNESGKHTYLNLQFSVQPNIPKLTPSIWELPSSDLPYIKDYIINWNESYNHSFPSRKFSALAINSSGKTTCLVRYIKALEPPQLNNEGFDVEPTQCAKFVSLIPFTNCNHFYQNVWLSTDQLLHLLSGSIIDHAVALTCFLLSLKLDVYLLLGYGLPHGSTAYVLLCEHSKETELPLYSIFDVVSGEKISILDAYCPLQRVYCVVREQNIWANIQRNDNVASTRFDFSRKSDWLPLFNGDISAPTNSVHNKIVYMTRQNAEELEVMLDRKIRKLIARSRPLNRTIWNKRVSNVVKNNIHLLDYVSMHGRTNQEISIELIRNISEYNVCGYILNVPYTNISTIIKKVKMYGVYFQEGTDVEFSLAVQVEAQPAFIASVWIFLAVVRDK
ncbi:coiled-coil and C2 domain-containing protein 2A isoform X2 [Harmonia axyridis]|uniref:coiled-coil and C2 domain-containing protein 2A isoform X2 n=1 Tax=Harmonia axyridis TaxID=115357 RepID=UPI001E277142|nr:coiled-coil and C2 domain-containing protein 2A isoform X2 [Harmonia axyridis]